VTAGGGRGVDGSDFRELYDAWVGDVARWIRALGAAASEQDDLIQQVFVVVYRRLPDFDGKNLAGWLYRITANQVRDFRRLRWIKHILKRSVPLSSKLPSPGPTPLSILETKDAHMLLERVLSTLSQAQRAAFVMFEIDGYTGEEIAEVQQVSVNTVRARIFRARKKLTALLVKWRAEQEEVSNRRSGQAEPGASSSGLKSRQVRDRTSR
jgi:RNA polymerase sigma-70 factor (ECF subfamily)